MHRLWPLSLLLACVDDPPSGPPTQPLSTPTETTSSPTGATPTTTATTTPTTEPPTSFADHCACPEDYDPANLVELAHGSHRTVRYDPPAFARDQLLIFLHGTNQSASNHGNILRTAAFAGLNVVAVTYENSLGGSVCMDQYADDLDWCIEQLRGGRIYGSEFPGIVAVDDEDSITALVWATLREAHLQEPKAGWDQFYDEADPAAVTAHETLLHWDRIVIGGFSQGASLAGFLAHSEAAAGAVVMSGPMDATSAWQLGPHATPIEDWVGFVHEREAQGDPIRTSFGRMGLGDPLTDVVPLDQGACETAPWLPYGGDQGFQSSLYNAGCDSPDAAHGSMGTDECMNVADAPAGDPYALFRPYLGAFCRAAED